MFDMLVCWSVGGRLERVRHRMEQHLVSRRYDTKQMEQHLKSRITYPLCWNELLPQARVEPRPMLCYSSFYVPTAAIPL